MTEPAAESDIERYYEEAYDEAARLTRSPHGRAEFARTQELLRRLLPGAPATARAVRPGGMVIAAAISRNAALMDMTQQGRVNAANLPSLLTAYATGINDPASGFTTAYFHRPDELAAEFTEAGLGDPQVFGIEGPLWPLLDAVDAQASDLLFVNAMTCARTFETDPAIIGASSHLLAAGRVSRAGR